MSPRQIILVLVLGTGVVAGWLGLAHGGPTRPTTAGAERWATPAITAPPLLGSGPNPSDTRSASQRPALAAGIPIGAGEFLPPLNGVKIEDGIPPVRRDPRLPPPGPVIAMQIDHAGQEWWVHADGSQTSCSYASVTLASGERIVIVSTQHGAPLAGPHGELRGR